MRVSRLALILHRPAGRPDGPKRRNLLSRRWPQFLFYAAKGTLPRRTLCKVSADSSLVVSVAHQGALPTFPGTFPGAYAVPHYSWHELCPLLSCLRLYDRRPTGGRQNPGLAFLDGCTAWCRRAPSTCRQLFTLQLSQTRQWLPKRCHSTATWVGTLAHHARLSALMR